MSARSFLLFFVNGAVNVFAFNEFNFLDFPGGRVDAPVNHNFITC